MMLTLTLLVLHCGPDFPDEYLASRAETLARLPDGRFALEVTRLVTPTDHFPAVVGEPAGWRDGGGAKEHALYAKASAAWKQRPMDAEAPLKQLLALPAQDRATFTLAAEYSLARLDLAPDATKRWARIRELVKGGMPDPLGLACASLGETAKVELEAGHDIAAIELYAQQAAQGSETGQSSLLFMARALASDRPRLEKALESPVVQRLMTTWLWTRATEGWWSDKAESVRENVLAALRARHPLAGADRLAAALFRAGRFEDAQALIEDAEPSALTHWVKAKLLVRAGKQAEAATELDAAATGVDPHEKWSNEYEPSVRPRAQLEIERAILALKQDDFPTATKHVLSSCAWQDIALFAERELTVDELMAVVAAPLPVDCSKAAETDYAPQDVLRDLRWLLGRRMLREHRGAAALPYFPNEVKPDAEAYVRALDAANTGTTIEQAQHLFEASRIARRKGLELLGTEVAPDFAWTGAEFTPDTDAHVEELTATEQDRRASSAPEFSQRYHYRHVSSALAERAAMLMTHRSQAYTAMLCVAARDIESTDPVRFQQLYREALGGPLLKEPMVFGESCPAPRFVAPPPEKHAPRYVRKRYRVLGIAGVMLVFAALGAMTLRRRP